MIRPSNYSCLSLARCGIGETSLPFPVLPLPFPELLASPSLVHLTSLRYLSCVFVGFAFVLSLLLLSMQSMLSMQSVLCACVFVQAESWITIAIEVIIADCVLHVRFTVARSLARLSVVCLPARRLSRCPLVSLASPLPECLPGCWLARECSAAAAAHTVHHHL